VTGRSPLRRRRFALDRSVIEEEEEEEEVNIFVFSEKPELQIINLDCVSEISSRMNGRNFQKEWEIV
jgi:hypothetical protein